jgi:hypothetical protein
LTEEEVECIPSWQLVDLGAIKENTLCCICQDELSLHDELKTLPDCQHSFHKHCINRWLMDCRSTCPICVKHVSPRPPTTTAWESHKVAKPPQDHESDMSNVTYQPQIVSRNPTPSYARNIRNPSRRNVQGINPLSRTHAVQGALHGNLFTYHSRSAAVVSPDLDLPTTSRSSSTRSRSQQMREMLLSARATC